MRKLLSIALATVLLASSIVAVPAQAANFQGGTIFETYDGSEVTLLPDFSADLDQDRAVIKDGGFETKGAFNDDLQAIPYWTGGAFEYNETDAVEGKNSIVLNHTKIADQQGELGFTGVFVEPCFEGQAYCLEFYTKLLAPLDGNPRIMIYFMDTNNGNAQPSTSIGTPNFTVSADSMKGSEWEAQKWVKVRHYFVTSEDFNEAAHTLQIQNMNMGGPVSNDMVAFDGFSLKKVYIDESTMAPELFEQEEPPAPKTLKFAKKSVKIKKGKKVTLKLKNATKKTTFSVDKKGKKVVKLLNKKGKTLKVKALKKGKATITAKLGKKKATCKITVK